MLRDIFKKVKASTFTGVFFGDTSEWKASSELSLYQKSLYTNKAINKRAEKMGQIDFVLTKNGEPVDNEWTELLRRPNNYQTGDQFWSLCSKYLDITGAAFILKKSEGIFGGVPDELRLLKSHEVTVNLSSTRDEIIEFIYDGKTYSPDEIIYIYRPNPSDPLTGESLISAASRSIDVDIQISEYHAKVLKNGGKPDQLFILKGIKTQEQLDEAEKRYSEKYAGARRAGKPLFASGEFEKIDLGLKPAELAFLETKISTLDDICIATGVPKVLLGVGSKETFANAEQSIRTFYEDTITPFMGFIVDILNWKMIPDEFELGFKDQTPDDIERKISVLKAAHETNSLSVNEKRALLSEFGMELEDRPEKDADSIFIPFNLTRLDSKAESKTEAVKKKSIHPLKNYENRRRYEERMVKALDREEEGFIEELRRYFNGQKERLLSETTKSLPSGFTIALEAKIAKEGLLPILRGIMKRHGEDVIGTFAVGRAFEMTPTIESWIDKRADVFTKQINETTFDTLRGQFTESAALNETRTELVRRIEDTYQNISESRAVTIAKTEVHGAMQKSSFEAQSQGGLETKIWVATLRNSRDSHIRMDGNEVGIKERFGNGLMFPGDPSGPPEEVINCECSI